MLQRGIWETFKIVKGIKQWLRKCDEMNQTYEKHDIKDCVKTEGPIPDNSAKVQFSLELINRHYFIQEEELNL